MHYLNIQYYFYTHTYKNVRFSFTFHTIFYFKLNKVNGKLSQSPLLSCSNIFWVI